MYRICTVYIVTCQAGETSHLNTSRRKASNEQRHDTLVKLVICKRVEWIHEQRTHPRALPLFRRLFQQRVEDGIEKTLRLAATSAGGNDNVSVLTHDGL